MNANYIGKVNQIHETIKGLEEQLTALAYEEASAILEEQFPETEYQSFHICAPDTVRFTNFDTSESYDVSLVTESVTYVGKDYSKVLKASGSNPTVYRTETADGQLIVIAWRAYHTPTVMRFDQDTLKAVKAPVFRTASWDQTSHRHYLTVNGIRVYQ